MASVKIGWYTDNVSQSSIDNLATYAAQGCTEMLAYNCYTSGVSATEDYLDEATAQGIKVWVDMRLHVLDPLPTEVEWKAFISGLKAHSAVKGWYIADEPEYSGPTYATIYQYYQWAKAEDANHPVSIAHAWYVRTEFAGPPLPYDELHLDVYPCWSGQGSGCYCSATAFNSDIRNVYSRWDAGKTAADGYSVDIGAVPLGFGNHPDSPHDCQGGVRDLTDAEHRWCTHIAVALGYTGVLFWWDMQEAGMIQTNDHYLGTGASGGIVATRFSEVADMAAEMGGGTTNDPAITVSVNTTKLIYRYGVVGDRHVILAVNVSRWDAEDNDGETLTDVTFTLPGSVDPPAQAAVLGESRNVTITNRVFTDTFTKFQVHAYAFDEPGTGTIPCYTTMIL